MTFENRVSRVIELGLLLRFLENNHPSSKRPYTLTHIYPHPQYTRKTARHWKFQILRRLKRAYPQISKRAKNIPLSCQLGYAFGLFEKPKGILNMRTLSQFFRKIVISWTNLTNVESGLHFSPYQLVVVLVWYWCPTFIFAQYKPGISFLLKLIQNW